MALTRRARRAAAVLWLPLIMSCTVLPVMAQQSPTATTAFHALIDEAWETDARNGSSRMSVSHASSMSA